VDVEIVGPSDLVAEVEAGLLPVASDFPAPPAADVESRAYGITPAGGNDLGEPVYSLEFAGHSSAGWTRRQLIRWIESDAKMWVTARSPDAVFVHAGVVAWQGRALLLPGPSHVGKTTLVAALVQAGATYYSDDYAVLDAEGRVWPCPLRLALRMADGKRVRRSIEELGGHAGSGPIEVGWVLETAFRPGAEFQPGPISAGQTLLCLLANAPSARTRPDAVMPVVARVARHAEGLRGERGDVISAVPEIFRLL
jgi:hypothetical protein